MVLCLEDTNKDRIQNMEDSQYTYTGTKENEIRINLKMVGGNKNKKGHSKNYNDYYVNYIYVFCI